MTIQFLDLQKQYLEIKDEIDRAISSVINDSIFIGGKYVKAFEEHFASYHKVKHCIGVANGTDAIEIALEALSLPSGSEVIVPANSFIATSEAVTRAGHRVIFCDCNPDTYTFSVEDAQKRITSNTKAIIVVHLYGHPCDMDSILEMAKTLNLKVIEDCAQAHGAEYKGQMVGGMGDVGTFSFYPGKNLGAYGDGGAIVTNDNMLAKNCRMIANHGRISKYDHEFEGRNSRLDSLQAAILDVKLKSLDRWILRRGEVADYYLNKLKGIPGLILPRQAEWAKHAWHLFVIRVQKRDELQHFLNDCGIQCGIHYPIALPKLKAYDYIGQGQESILANCIDSELLSIPIGEHLCDTDLQKIVEKIKSFMLIKSRFD